MCGIAGCYQQADGRKLTDVMTDRIAHRGPDAGGVWSHEDERVLIAPGPPAAVDHRPVHRRRPAAAQGRPDARLQRRALQLQGAAGRAPGRRRELRHPVRHRGRARGLALLGPGGAAQVPWHVRVRARRHRDGRAGAGPRPAGHQAALLPPARRRHRVRLGTQGAAGGARRRTADRARRARGVHALLLGPGAALRHPRACTSSRQAPGRASARGQGIEVRHVLARPGRGRRGSRPARPPT